MKTEAKRKELPQPGYVLRVTPVTSEDFEYLFELQERIVKLGFEVSIVQRTYSNCLSCDEYASHGRCPYGLKWSVCPKGGLFSLRREAYLRARWELEARGFDTSGLPP